MRDGRAQKIKQPRQRQRNQRDLQRVRQQIAKLEQAADGPASRAARPDKLRAHQHGDAQQRRRIGPIDRTRHLVTLSPL